MPHLAPGEARQARDLEAVGAPALDRALDLVRELGRHALIGVDREHPIAPGERQREILLRPETAPFMGNDAGTFLRGDRRGAIRTAGVYHDALVAKGEAVEAGADVRLLVLGDDDGAQARHLIQL